MRERHVLRRCLAVTSVLMASLLSSGIDSPLVAWSDHHYNAQWVRDTLGPFLVRPDGRPSFSSRDWDEYVTLYSFYPDWGADRARVRQDELWSYFREAQASERFDTTHSNRTSVVYFRRLLESFAAGDARKAALWSGALTHVIGDAAAANHPPLLAYITYGYGRTLGLRLASSGETLAGLEPFIDVKGPSDDELGRKYVEAGLRGYKPTLLADNGEDAAVAVQLMLQTGFLAALKEDGPIARGLESWRGRNDPAGKDLLMRGMAHLIVRCSRDVADVIYTAQTLAARGRLTFDVDRALTKAEPAIARLRKGVSLSAVSAYDGILRETSASPAIGVLLGVPPIYWVTDGSVDLQLCYFLSLIARTLASQQVPYVTYDITQLPATLSPQRTPILIVPSYLEGDGLSKSGLERRLRAYSDGGGKILFLGGQSRDAIKPLSEWLVVSPESDRFYPIDGKTLRGKSLVIAKELAAAEAPMRFVRVMDEYSTRTFGAYILKPERPSSIRPLLWLDSGERQVAVSGGYVERGAFRTIYVPWWVFMPGSFSTSDELQSLDRPALDASGARILSLLLDLLKPSPGTTR